MNNRKLDLNKLNKIIKVFCLDISASDASKKIKINRNTINHWYFKFRKIIYNNQIKLRSIYFINKSKNNISIKNKNNNLLLSIEIFNNIFIDISDQKNKETIRRIIYNNKIDHESIFSQSHYNGLIDVKNSKCINIFNNKYYKNSELKLFWHFCESRFTKFNGISLNFDFHLKECEWRWKNKNFLEKNLRLLLKQNKIL